MRSASLNHVYRLVWSDAAQAHVAVAENGPARGKRSRLATLLAALGLLGSGAALAGPLPTGGTVTSGAASLAQSAQHLDVQQHSERLAMDWQSFDIGREASVTFHQPGADSIALNRVVGGGPASQLQGRLEANGQVWLLNPNGVVIGKGAQLDVGGLVAASLQLSDEDFRKGQYRFTQGSGAGAVSNQGDIRTGSGGVVALVGPQVSNGGSIATPGGSTVLAAGDKVSLDFQGDGLLGVNVERGVLNALVENEGRISADGGAITLSARAAEAAISSVVNNSGTLEAHSLVARNGRILLEGDDHGVVQVAGTLDVSSAQGQGGSLAVTAGQVALNGAQLRADGATGGGSIKVGGGWQGQDGSIANARQVTVDERSSLSAAATGQGDGGTVVAWSDGDNRFAGRISVRGGEQGGNGGKAEVSGKQTLVYAGVTDARASHGHTGDLLLDPTNITIEGGSGDSGNWASGSGDVTLYAATLEAQSANVLLQAERYITFKDLNDNGGDGDITMQRDVSFRAEAMNNLSGNPDDRRASIRFTNASNTLKVSGTGSIYMNGGGGGSGYGTIGDRPSSGSTFITPGSGAFNLVAGDVGDRGANPAITALPDHNVGLIGSGTPGAGSITLLGADGILVSGNITTHGGYVRLSGDSDVGGGGAIDLTKNITTNGGNLYVYFGNSDSTNVATIGGEVRLGTGRLVFGDEVNAATNSRNSLGASTGVKRLSGLLELSGNVNFSTPLTLLGGARIQTNGDINFNSILNLDTQDNPLTLRASNISFAGATLQNVSTASLVLEPYDPATNIQLDGRDGIVPANTFTQLTGVRNLTIGRADGTGTTTVSNAGFSFSAGRNFTLLNGTMQINGRLENSSATGALIARAVQSDVTLGVGGAMAARGTGDAVVAAAAGNFVNFAGSDGLEASNGRWLTYSTSPLADTRGGLPLDFKQYDVRYGQSVAQSSGNGHLYSLAPVLSTALTGTVSKTYDGTNQASVAASQVQLVGGSLDGDQVRLALGSGSQAFYDSKDVGNGKRVTVQGVVLDSATNGNVAVYGYQLASSVSANIGTILRKVLTGTATAASKVYDGTATAQLSGFELVGVLAADQGQVSASGTGAFADRHVGTGKTVSVVGVTLGGAAAGNYSFDPLGLVAQADITPRLISGTATAASKDYDGTTTAHLSGFELLGVLAADQGQVSASGTGVFADRHVGTGKTVSVVGVTLGGAAAGNYSFDPLGLVAQADITPRLISGTATAASKDYDGTTTAHLSDLELVGVLAADQGQVSASGTGAFADRQVGTGKAVSGAGVILGGAAAGNYRFDTQARLAQADITPRLISGTATAASKDYDGTTTAYLSDLELVGVLAADQGQVSASGTGAFADSQVGTGKAVSGAGVILGGAAAGNYRFDTHSQLGQADIRHRVIGGSVQVGDRPYDGSLNAPLVGITLQGVLAGDQVQATGQAFYDSAAAAEHKPVRLEGVQLSGADAGNYRLDLGLLAGSGNVTAIPTPVALVAPAQGVNGTAVAASGLGDDARQSFIGSLGTTPAGARLEVDVSPVPVGLDVAGAPPLTGSLLRRGGANTSFAYAGAPVDQPLRTELVLYRQNAGQPALGLGTYEVQDQGSDLLLTQQNGLHRSAPELSGATGPWIEGQAMETGGGLLPLRIKLAGDGTLLVQASAASNLTDEEWASYGLILAKSRLNASVTSVKAVVILRPDASVGLSAAEAERRLAAR